MAQGAASVSGKRLFRARFVPRTDGRRRGGDAGSDSLVVAAGSFHAEDGNRGSTAPEPGWRCLPAVAAHGRTTAACLARLCTHGNPRPCRVPIMKVSFRRSRTVPASKPVADPARSTDPRDYQRVGRPLGVMATTFPAGFVVAEHRHERAQLIHALSGVIELHVGRTLWLVRRSARYGCRRGWRTRCWRAARSACTPSMSGRSPARRNSPGAARSDGQPIVARVDRARRRPAVVVRRARPGGAVDGGAAGRTGVVAEQPLALPDPRTDAWEESARRCWRTRPTLAGWRSGRATWGRPRGPWHGCFSPSWE